MSAKTGQRIRQSGRQVVTEETVQVTQDEVRTAESQTTEEDWGLISTKPEVIIERQVKTAVSSVNTNSMKVLAWKMGIKNLWASQSSEWLTYVVWCCCRMWSSVNWIQKASDDRTLLAQPKLLHCSSWFVASRSFNTTTGRSGNESSSPTDSQHICYHLQLFWWKKPWWWKRQIHWGTSLFLVESSATSGLFVLHVEEKRGVWLGTSVWCTHQNVWALAFIKVFIF